MDITLATELAQEKLSAIEQDVRKDLMFSPGGPCKDSDGWLFSYNTKEVFETGNPLTALVGNVPIHVDQDGVVTFRKSR